MQAKLGQPGHSLTFPVQAVGERGSEKVCDRHVASVRHAADGGPEVIGDSDAEAIHEVNRWRHHDTQYNISLQQTNFQIYHNALQIIRAALLCRNSASLSRSTIQRPPTL